MCLRYKTTLTTTLNSDKRKVLLALWTLLSTVALAMIGSCFVNWNAVQAITNHSSARLTNQPCAPAAEEMIPFVDLVPSLEGTELVVEIYAPEDIGQQIAIAITVDASGDTGGTGDKVSWTPIDPNEVVTKTLAGLKPEVNLTGSISLTVGSQQRKALFTRSYVKAATPQSLVSADSNLQLTIVSTDTFPATDSYLTIMSSVVAPGYPTDSSCLTSEIYNIRAANALHSVERPMGLEIVYNESLLLGADPHTVGIVAWNRQTSSWETLPAMKLLSSESSFFVPITHFTTYALLASPVWWDNFDDLSGLNIADEEIDNLTLGGSVENRGLILFNPAAGQGYAISQPISPTNSIAKWGELTFESKAEPPTTTISIDVLSVNNQVLLSAVPSGTDIGELLSVEYPTLKLRANLSSTGVNESPALYSWQLAWQVAIPTPTVTPIPTVTFPSENHNLYLPYVGK